MSISKSKGARTSVYRKSAFVLFLVSCFCIPVMAPASARAQAFDTGTVNMFGHQFVWAPQWLVAGIPATFETRNLERWNGSAWVPGGDTVMYLFDYWVTTLLAQDDDGAVEPNASRITYIPPVTGNYWLLITAKTAAAAGRCDVIGNIGGDLIDARFGGITTQLSAGWPLGTDLRVTATSRAPSYPIDHFANDYMLFLFGATGNFVGFDDDSGPNRYPLLLPGFPQASGTVLWGHYPLSLVGTAHMTSHVWSAGNDNDSDGLNNHMEALIGSNANLTDSDWDGVPDTIEFFGNDGYSFSESGAASTVVQNLHVEVDYMAGKMPFANLGPNATFTFASLGNIVADFYIDTQVPYNQVINTGSTCNLPGCLPLAGPTGYKAQFFSPANSEIQTYFHYGLFAAQYEVPPPLGSPPGTPWIASCSSGAGEQLGNDFIVTLDTSGFPPPVGTSNPTGCFWAAFGQAQANQQEGTFVHELGHNLNLTHNGNNDPFGNWSTIHWSVMNYLYQMGNPVPPPPAGLFQYSFGTQPCMGCIPSPKQACIALENAGLCGTPAGAVCDCDVNEWGSLILPFQGDPDYQDGAPGPGHAGVSLQEIGKERPAATRARGDKLRDDKVEGWKRPLLQERREHRIERIRRQVSELKDQGLQEVRDFRVSEDGLGVWLVEKDGRPRK